MALFGSYATVRAQAPVSPGFGTAFSYLDALLGQGSPAAVSILAMAAGDSRKVELGEGVFAIEQVYATKPRPDGFFESHRKYVDIQVILEGGELMEVVDVSRACVRQPYDAERDLIVYQDSAAGSQLRVEAGQATVFHPADVHMPGLRLGSAPVLVRKSVVKVPVV